MLVMLAVARLDARYKVQPFDIGDEEEDDNRSSDERDEEEEERDGMDNDGDVEMAEGSSMDPAATDKTSKESTLGPGVEASAEERVAVVEGLRKMLNENVLTDTSWSIEDFDTEDYMESNLDIWIHKRAAIQYTTQLTSIKHTGLSKRVDHLVQVAYDLEVEQAVYMGNIQYFARVQLNGKPDVVRVAMCKFYEKAVEVGDKSIGTVFRVKKFEDENDSRNWSADSRERPYPVELQSIDGKVVSFEPPLAEKPYNYLFCTTYAFKSGS